MLVLLVILIALTLDLFARFYLVPKRRWLFARSSKILDLLCIFEVFPILVIFLVYKYLFNLFFTILQIRILLVLLKLNHHFLKLIYRPSINIQSILISILLLFIEHEPFKQRLTVSFFDDLSHQIPLFHHSIYCMFINLFLNLTLILDLELAYFLRIMEIITWLSLF